MLDNGYYDQILEVIGISRSWADVLFRPAVEGKRSLGWRATVKLSLGVWCFFCESFFLLFLPLLHASLLLIRPLDKSVACISFNHVLRWLDLRLSIIRPGYSMYYHFLYSKSRRFHGSTCLNRFSKLLLEVINLRGVCLFASLANYLFPWPLYLSKLAVLSVKVIGHPLLDFRWASLDVFYLGIDVLLGACYRYLCVADAHATIISFNLLAA